MLRPGSNEFRNHIGHHLERAAAGAEIHISRPGRPFARLPPAEPSLREHAAQPGPPELTLLRPA